MAPERFVTYKEMVESQEVVKKDILDRMEKEEQDFDKLKDKVDTINDLVLPLTVSMKQTAENTKKISESLNDFTTNQSKTNTYFSEQISAHSLAIKGITEKKKYNVTLLVAVIGFLGTFIAGLFQLAPLIFG